MFQKREEIKKPIAFITCNIMIINLIPQKEKSKQKLLLPVENNEQKFYLPRDI
jgi:hypothetical protein